MDIRFQLIEIFNKSVASVRPENVFPDLVSLEDDSLCVGERRYDLSGTRGIHVFGSGKAAAGSAKILERILGDRLSGGLVISTVADSSLKKIPVCLGSHPVADERGIDATDQLIERMSGLTVDDFYIYLLSGGSSALLERPVPPLTLSDLQDVTKLLLASGVPIEDMNAVRKHLSLVKGGRLGRMTGARGVALVMSDVIGDDLDTIGSAPLYRDRTTFQDVCEILEKYGLWDQLPASVADYVRRGAAGMAPDTPKEANPRIDHLLVASNFQALEKAKQTALSSGIPAYIMTSRLHGEAREAAKAIAAIGREIMASGNPFPPPVCLLFGGETTVTLRGDGRGGRNQEICLAVVKEMAGWEGWTFLSAGTDGIDGNSDAAGAVADASTLQKAREIGLNIDDYLSRNDSNGFFKQTGELLITGPTGTNVMDLAILYIGGNPSTQDAVDQDKR